MAILSGAHRAEVKRFHEGGRAITKILHIIPSFGFGGMEKVICSIINHTLHHYHHNILILNGDDRAFEWIQSDDIHHIKFFKNKNSFRFLIQLYKEIKNSSPDLLMTYNWGGTDAIWIGKLAGVKHIIHHEHGFSLEESYKTSHKRNLIRFILYRMASCLVSVSLNLALSIKINYWLPESKIKIITNGIDTSYYSPNLEVRLLMRNELHFSDNDFVIVFSGRLDPVKNFNLLLEVFDYCHKSDENIKLLIVGDGPERSKIEQICREKNIYTHLIMVGQRADVLPYLRAGDVFLLTSLTEQMPLTILEAMSVGLPVIASDVGDIRTIIDDGKDGFLRNIHHGCEGFATALLSLRQESNWQMMSRAARSKIVLAFQETMMVRCYQTLIDCILDHDRL
jgi:glycosyltransferase involved in cell wall biosynthesis